MRFIANPTKLIVLITVAHAAFQKISFAHQRWDFSDGAGKGAHRKGTEEGFGS